MQTLIHTKGFTLVETLVAITILIMVIVGPMTIAQKGVQNAYVANDQVTAVFLAQEAIEAVRQLRDDKALDAYSTVGNVADTASWLPSLCNTTQGCAFELGGNPLFEPCSSTNYQCLLYWDSSTGLYSHSGGVPSIFTRKVIIGNQSDAGGVSVNVSVTWSNHGTPKEVKLQTWIYNHYERYED